MSLTKIGLNFAGLKNMKPLNISIDSSPEAIITNLPITANRLTQNFYGLLSSLTLFIFLFWYISDLSQFGDFKYSKFRALAITSTIVTMFGIIFLNVGYFVEFYHIMIFAVIAVITSVFVYKEEN